jgi:hypothetical protein
MANNDLNKTLAQIHEQLLGDVLKDLKDKEKRTPNLMRVALDILKHNNITAVNTPGSALNKLEKTLESIPSDDEFMSLDDVQNVLPMRKRQ